MQKSYSFCLLVFLLIAALLVYFRNNGFWDTFFIVFLAKLVEEGYFNDWEVGESKYLECLLVIVLLLLGLLLGMLLTLVKSLEAVF